MNGKTRSYKGICMLLDSPWKELSYEGKKRGRLIRWIQRNRGANMMAIDEEDDDDDFENEKKITLYKFKAKLNRSLLSSLACCSSCISLTT